MYSDYAIAKKYIRKADDAKKRNIAFGLSLVEFKRIVNRKRCQLTNILLTKSTEDQSGPLPTSPTIDRIDSTLGYVPGNCIVVCHAVNQWKAILESNDSALRYEHGIVAMSNLDKLLKAVRIKCAVGK